MENVCDQEKDSIIIEPVYFRGKGIIELKSFIKHSFYGAFTAIIFIYYMKIMSNPITAFLYTIMTAIFISYSGVDSLLYSIH